MIVGNVLLNFRNVKYSGRCGQWDNWFGANNQIKKIELSRSKYITSLLYMTWDVEIPLN